ncbi:GPN-loop GTPase [Nematocida major]|uniref:GPN-loop GTPase n=1 Tax=Nematocida major TaxID=1912982 RepID=UPI002007ECFE|nr:GPN-loop GTPase [Nematocida major]KAH9386724.1 GPN-loop GTPase [Nematocida major]
MGYALFVIGPAGSGKTSLSHMLKEYYTSQNRSVSIINLDPAQTLEDLDFSFDIRNHIEVAEIMEEADFGPNGALMAGLEAISDHLDVMELPEDDGAFLIFDCPGQIELYVHSDSIMKIVQEMGKNHYTMAIYALDATHAFDTAKFVSAAVSATISMCKFEVPHINVLTKCDLVPSEDLEDFLFGMDIENIAEKLPAHTPREKKFNHALTTIIRDQGLLGFIPLDYKKENSLEALAYQIDTCVQYIDAHEDDD